MSYADITTNEKNRLKRWLQNRRLDDALVYPQRQGFSRTGGTALDFGGGDAGLSRRIEERFSGYRPYCYEPSSEIRAEATAACAGTEVSIVGSLEDLGATQFDFVTCCEVFEHLPDAQADAALDEMKRLCADDGVIIIGVPNEIFLVGLLKGFFRMTRRYGAYDARWGTVLAAASGRPRTDRPVLAIDGLPFIYPHTGFDYRQLIARLRRHGLQVVMSYGSPFRRGPRWLNSEIYLVARRSPV